MSHRATFEKSQRYRLRVTGDGTRPVQIAQASYAPGTTYTTPSLAEVVHLLRNGLAEPVDARTRLDGSLGIAVQAAIPRPSR